MAMGPIKQLLILIIDSTFFLYLESNPPVRLLCGHAISHDAMKKLVNLSGRSVYVLYL